MLLSKWVFALWELNLRNTKFYKYHKLNLYSSVNLKLSFCFSGMLCIAAKKKIQLLILSNSLDCQGSRLGAVLQSVTSDERNSVADTTQEGVEVTYSRLADLSLSETSHTIPSDTSNLDLGQCLFKQNITSKAKRN